MTGDGCEVCRGPKAGSHICDKCIRGQLETLHRNDGYGFCACCDYGWPCATIRIINGEDCG